MGERREIPALGAGGSLATRTVREPPVLGRLHLNRVGRRWEVGEREGGWEGRRILKSKSSRACSLAKKGGPCHQAAPA